MNKVTLVFPVEPGFVWLALKCRKVGAGLWNGWGGKFDPSVDRTLLDAAKREFIEEAGIRPTERPEGHPRDWPKATRKAYHVALAFYEQTLRALECMQKVAIIDFYEEGVHKFECHTYFCHALPSWPGRVKWAHRLSATPEMTSPCHFNTWGLPFERMMPVDREVLPRLLNGELLRGSCYYNRGKTKMVKPFEPEVVDTATLLAA